MFNFEQIFQYVVDKDLEAELYQHLLRKECRELANDLSFRVCMMAGITYVAGAIDILANITLPYQTIKKGDIFANWNNIVIFAREMRFSNQTKQNLPSINILAGLKYIRNDLNHERNDSNFDNYLFVLSSIKKMLAIFTNEVRKNYFRDEYQSMLDYLNQAYNIVTGTLVYASKYYFNIVVRTDRSIKNKRLPMLFYRSNSQEFRPVLKNKQHTVKKTNMLLVTKASKKIRAKDLPSIVFSSRLIAESNDANVVPNQDDSSLYRVLDSKEAEEIEKQIVALNNELEKYHNDELGTKLTPQEIKQLNKELDDYMKPLHMEEMNKKLDKYHYCNETEELNLQLDTFNLQEQNEIVDFVEDTDGDTVFLF